MIKDIDKQTAVVAAMGRELFVTTALMGGTTAMRAAGEALLPKFPQEEAEAYKARLKTAVLHNLFRKTVRSMAAKPFIQAMQIEPKLSNRLSVLEDDADLQGTNINEFMADRLVESIAYGVTGVLVDFKGDGRGTLAQEKATGSRPYFTTYPLASILGWRYTNNALVQLRLLETLTEPSGEFGETSVTQVRVLTPGAWAVYRKKPIGDEWYIHEEGSTSLSVIPFVFFYGVRLAYGIGESPLIDLAYLNVEHWQSSSDQQTILHTARVPILFARGFGDDDKLVVGAGIAAKCNADNADLKWVEHSGAAIGAGRASLIDLEARMRELGAEMLVKRAGNATATEVLSDNETNKSTLQNIVEETEDAIERCLEFAGMYVGDSTAYEVNLYKDFSVDASGADMDFVLRAHDAGVLTADAVKSEMRRRDIISEEVLMERTPPPKTDEGSTKPA